MSETSSEGRRREPAFGDIAAGVWHSLPFPALVLATDNRIVAANPAAEQFLGTSAAIMRKLRLDAFCGEGSRLLDMLAQARRGLLSISEYGVELELKQRAPAVVDLQAAAMFDQEDHVLLLIQPRSVAAAIDRSMNQHGAARSLTGLSSMMAHEIKNPLAGISGAAQLLEMTLGEEEADLLHLIHDEVDRIRTLVDQMDAFGQAGALERRPVNIHDVLSQARRSAAAGYGRHVRFREIYDPSLPPVPGDRAQLLQAVSNLVKNACEAAPTQGAEVTLRTAFRPGFTIAVSGGARVRLPLEVTVQDNGPGVPEDLRAHIFEPFVTSKSGGTGLGLALVGKIIADHGGVVEYGRQNERSAFRLLLPVWRADDAETAAAPSAAPAEENRS